MDKLAKCIEDGNVASYLSATHLASLVPAGPLGFDLIHSFHIFSLPSQILQSPWLCGDKAFLWKWKAQHWTDTFLPLSSLMAGSRSFSFTSRERQGENLVSHPPSCSHDHMLDVLPPASVFSTAFLGGTVGKEPENVTTPGSGTTWELPSLSFSVQNWNK